MSALAAALSEFQAKVGAVPRSREVTVQTKTGGSYKFKYAPHEAIIEAIREPLGAAGLSVSQHLSTDADGGPALRTILLHSSGEKIEDTFPLPARDGMTAQELGSAITYIRRYALSAVLGLATDDDDDGNHASGTAVTSRQDKPRPDLAGATEHLLGVESAEGTVKLGGPDAYKLQIRQAPDGPAFGFRLDMAGGKAIPQVIVSGPAATVALAAQGGDPMSLLDHKVRVKGQLFSVRQEGRTTFNRLHVTEIATKEWKYPATDNADPARVDGGEAATGEPSEPLDAEIAAMSF